MKRLIACAAACAVAMLASACTVTGSDGVAVTVTPANFADLVVAKVKKECPKVQQIANGVQLVAPAVAQTVNQAGVGQTASDVAKAASDACARITAVPAPGPTASG